MATDGLDGKRATLERLGDDEGDLMELLDTSGSSGDSGTAAYKLMREATEEHARPVPDGGSVEVKAVDSAGGETIADVIEGLLDSLSTTQTVGLAVGGLVLLAAVSGDRGGPSRSGGSKVACPECGEKKSKRGMMGHLRWSHDLDSAELDDAKAKAGIGQ
jgi:hypothetical protein